MPRCWVPIARFYAVADTFLFVIFDSRNVQVVPEFVLEWPILRPTIEIQCLSRIVGKIVQVKLLRFLHVVDQLVIFGANRAPAIVVGLSVIATKLTPADPTWLRKFSELLNMTL
jgi:hypothetical protein